MYSIYLNYLLCVVVRGGNGVKFFGHSAFETTKCKTVSGQKKFLTSWPKNA